MHENVGREDQFIRSFLGPAIMMVGFLALGGRRGKLAGLATIVVGVLVTESAVTRVCPVNYLIGMDTRTNGQLNGHAAMDAETSGGRSGERPYDY
jgi:hypothetical protein